MKPNEDMKCGICDTPVFERNNYFYGKQLTVRDLLQEQNYLNEKRRLINRAVLGWGVVCGLEVTWDKDNAKFVVCPGLALDCCGHEILVCTPHAVPFGGYAAIHSEMDAKPDYVPERYVLCLSYQECKAEPVDLPPVSCGCDQRSQYNRTRETFQLQLVKWGDTCLAHPLQPDSCPDHIKKPVNADDAQAAPCTTETLHEYLCGRLKHCPDCPCKDCVILGTIEISRPRRDTSQPADARSRPGLKFDACTYRKLVYRNPLLFDLIDCYHGDLPHIVDFSWRKDVYPKHSTTFEHFVSMIENGLTVTFDAAMDPGSPTRCTFLVTFLREEEGTGSVIGRPIPASKIECGQQGACFHAKFVADPDWIGDELKSSKTELADGVTVEITLRGSRIHSPARTALAGELLND